ncbi:MAG: hypothetical protein ACKOF9_10640 [Burkholderiales bacterium]
MSRVPACAQVMHLPEEEFLNAEADDVTVCDPIERDAEPQAFLILVNPVTGQSSDVDHILGGVKNLIAACGPRLLHLLDGVFTCRVLPLLDRISTIERQIREALGVKRSFGAGADVNSGSTGLPHGACCSGHWPKATGPQWLPADGRT